MMFCLDVGCQNGCDYPKLPLMAWIYCDTCQGKFLPPYDDVVPPEIQMKVEAALLRYGDK